jgi:predicted O-methyltransferase YrrM
MGLKGGLERALDRCNAVLRPTRLQIAWYTGADARTAAALKRQGATLRHRELQLFRGITAPGHVTIEESRFLAELAQASDPARPIIEIGTLFGFSTLVLARAKHPRQRLITVDNYCWNPLGLSPDAHVSATHSVLRDAVAAQQVELVTADKAAFYRSYDGPPPALFFCDADHAYEATLDDLRWARAAGASIVCGHDHDPVNHPGVVRAVHDVGGAREVRGTLFVLR